MRHFRQNRLFIAWLACLTVLLNALTPALSHALADNQSDSGSWTAICSASGTKFVPSPFAQTSDEKSGSGSMDLEHCPYCLPHAGSLALLPATLSVFALGSAPHTLPARLDRASSSHLAWSAAYPRAPPASA